MGFSIKTAIGLTAACLFSALVHVQASGGPIRYPGYPGGNFNASWQTYFEVTDPLPNITFDIGRNFAGNLPIQRGTNLSLFYWAIEHQNGSLTDEESTASWQIWLNGGPGSSSLNGLLFENGPIRINHDYSAYYNKYSYSKLADTIWIDQPVGTGWSTLEADGTGWVTDEDQMASDFFGFLGNLVKVFPGLAKRPLHIMGESYAGMYIPYIAKYYFGLTNPPINLSKIVIGDGTIGNGVEFEVISTIYVLETFPQLIGYDVEVFKWFQQQNHLCGYDVNITYPQNCKLPTLAFRAGIGAPSIASEKSLAAKLEKRSKELKSRGLVKRGSRREEALRQRKRDLSLRANGTIDPYYGCSLLLEVVDYAVNYTYPWNGLPGPSDFDLYSAVSVLYPGFGDASVFLNSPAVEKALHAPDVSWRPGIPYNFGGLGTYFDPSQAPMVFLDDLATNATAQNIPIILISGNTDTLVPHRGTEVVIQNTTFGGIQGFTQKPSTPWYNDDGTFAGIVHQERGWTYALFHSAGHLIPMDQPAAAWTFVRDFVLGSSTLGLVEKGGSVTGSQKDVLSADILPEGPEIYMGGVVTTSTYVYPSATIAQWYSHMATDSPSPVN